jgi:hypothetical protein
VKNDSKRFSERQCVVDVQTVKRQSIYGYRAGEHVPFLRIVMTVPFQISAARRILESGLQIGGDLGSYSCQHSFGMYNVIDAIRIQLGVYPEIHD